LSDLLFILSRATNVDEGPPARAGAESESLWDPGAHGAGTASQPA
jgi:hypothetical protein